MKSQDPGRYKSISKIEEAIHAGEERDPKTGRPNVLAKEDEIVELEPGDTFWLLLANKMAAAVPPDGTLPLPSEARLVFEHGLGTARILHPENQVFALEQLEYYFAGRAEGLAVRFEKTKSRSGDKSKKKRLGGRRNPRRTTRPRRR